MRRILITLAALALAALAVPAAASAHHGQRAGDRNRDGLPDRWERQHHLSLRVNQAHRDPDHDGLDNRKEFEHGTDPRNRDTNDNGVGDRNEIHPVGTIASFDAQNGALTITLANGQSVTGQVTPATRIECRENENEIENEHPNGDNFAVRHGEAAAGTTRVPARAAATTRAPARAAATTPTRRRPRRSSRTTAARAPRTAAPATPSRASSHRHSPVTATTRTAAPPASSGTPRCGRPRRA